MKPEKKRRNIVARVLNAENKTEAILAEAKRAGVHPRTVERWVETTEAAVPTVRQDAVPQNTVPSEKSPENKVLDTVLKDEGGAAEGPITATEKVQGAVDAAQFCVDAYSELKASAGSILVGWKFTPPLDASSEEVVKLYKIGVMVDMALRVNAPMLYPIIAKHMGGLSRVLGLVAADAVGMMLGLQGLAKSKGWKPEAKKPTPADVPSERSYAESLKPAPPPPPQTSTASNQPGVETVVNAPIPTPEQVALATAVRQVVS